MKAIMQARFTRGFTLIELLVVIAIIALLAGMMFVSLGGVLPRSRDARRIEDLQNLRKALATYVATGSSFPIANTAEVLVSTSGAGKALIDSGVISAMPTDPRSGTLISGGPTYDFYYTSTSGLMYMITFCLETSSIRNYVQGCDTAVNKITP